MGASAYHRQAVEGRRSRPTRPIIGGPRLGSEILLRARLFWFAPIDRRDFRQVYTAGC